jgi:LPS export ABC transporter permease LptG/LPS export ABC transporter permease LptF
MLSLIDRYILREVTAPFLVGVFGCSFILIANEIIRFPELFIAQDVSFILSLKLLFYLLPPILSFTIPMSVLVGILAGFSRLSSDSEILAMKAHGVSYARILRPLILFSFICWLVTSSLTLYIAPYFNFKWIETSSECLEKNIQIHLEPGRFIDEIPNVTLYFQKGQRDGLLEDLFIKLTDEPRKPRYIVARSGKLIFDIEKGIVALDLNNILYLSRRSDDPGRCEIASALHMVKVIDITDLYYTHTVVKHAREKNIHELITDLNAKRSLLEQCGYETGDSELKSEAGIAARQADESECKNILRDLRSYEIEINKKFALALVCMIYPFLGLPMGMTIKKGGNIKGFVAGLIIILVYYFIMVTGEKFAMSGHIPASVGMWMGNILFLIIGTCLFVRTAKEQSFIPIDKLLYNPMNKFFSKEPTTNATRSRINISFTPTVIDRYIARKCMGIAALILPGAVAVLSIVAFSEGIGNIIEHQKPVELLFEYLLFRIPEFIHLGLPLTIVIASVLTLSLMDKFNEVTAMKACGLSTYQIIRPLLVSAIIFSGVSLYMGESVLPKSNRKAAELWSYINDIQPPGYGNNNEGLFLDRSGRRFFEFKDSSSTSSGEISLFNLDTDSWTLNSWIYSNNTNYHDNAFEINNYQKCEFEGYSLEKCSYYDKLAVPMDMDYISNQGKKDPSQMTFKELSEYIREIQKFGIDTVRLQIDLYSKASFPLAILVLTIVSIPLGLGMRRHYIMIRVGCSLILALFFWLAIGVFNSMGYGGYLDVKLAAWGADILFGFVGLLFFFRLRTQ